MQMLLDQVVIYKYIQWIYGHIYAHSKDMFIYVFRHLFVLTSSHLLRSFAPLCAGRAPRAKTEWERLAVQGAREGG